MEASQLVAAAARGLRSVAFASQQHIMWISVCPHAAQSGAK